MSTMMSDTFDHVLNRVKFCYSGEGGFQLFCFTNHNKDTLIYILRISS